MAKVESIDELLEIMHDKSLEHGYVFLVRSLELRERDGLDSDGEADNGYEIRYTNHKVFGTIRKAVEYAATMNPDDGVKVDCFDIVGEGVVEIYSYTASENGIEEPVIVIECFNIES